MPTYNQLGTQVQTLFYNPENWKITTMPTFGRYWWQTPVSSAGPCITITAIGRCRNSPFSFNQRQRSFQRKLLSHWLKFLQHRYVEVVALWRQSWHQDNSRFQWLTFAMVMEILWPIKSGLMTQTVYSTTKYMVIYKGDEIVRGTIVALHGMIQMY